MKSKRAFLIELLVACLSITQSSSRAQTAQVSAVSLANPGAIPGLSAGEDSFALGMTPDGAFVLFASLANNLVTNPCDGVTVQLFLRCRTNELTRLVSINAEGTAGGYGDSVTASVTPDGRYVVFESDAEDLVTNDLNGRTDVFVRDTVSGTTRLVSVNHLATSSGNGASYDPVITPDGRYVAFASEASDLVGGDANAFPDIFLRDMQSGVTTLVSVGARKGNASLSNLAATPGITPDGRFVTFTSTGSNLVASTQKTYQEVYVREMAAGLTIWASTNVSTATAPASYMPTLSDDGRYVTFKTSAGSAFLILRRDLLSGNLDVISTAALGISSVTPEAFGPAMTPDGRFVAFTGVPTSGGSQVWVWDAHTQSAVLASANLAGLPSTNGVCDTPAITPDGRFVAFLSSGTDLTADTVNGAFQVYRRDLQSGATTLVSKEVLGAGTGDAGSSIPALSADGQFVLFESRSPGFVSGDLNDAYDVFLRNTVEGTNELVSVMDTSRPSLTANGSSTLSGDAVSADGRYVVFGSVAKNLVAGVTNDLKQVYLRDRQSEATTLISVNRFGTGASDGYASEVSLSADGRYAVFVSDASDLVANDTNRLADVFLRDLVMGQTMLISVATNGWSGNRLSEAPSISADGRWVAFQSPANNLAPNDSDSFSYDVFVRDLVAGITILASTNFPGDSSAPSHSAPILSPDGNCVAFQSYTATAAVRVKNLQTGSTTAIPMASISDLAFSGNSRLLAIVGKLGASNVLVVADVVSRTNTTIGIGTGTVPGSQCVSLNADGRYVALSCRSPLSGTDTNNAEDVFVCDLATRNLTLISSAPGGLVAGNDRSYQPRLSADGRLVVFRSFASDLVPDDANGTSDLFQYDRVTGQMIAITHRQADTATASGMSLGFAMASGANCIAFTSIANDLIIGDANGELDVFAAELNLDVPKVTVAFHAGQTTLVWPATPILPRRIQYKDSLNDPLWHDLAASVIVNGATASVSDTTIGSAPQRFYRLTWEP